MIDSFFSEGSTCKGDEKVLLQTQVAHSICILFPETGNIDARDIGQHVHTLSPSVLISITQVVVCCWPSDMQAINAVRDTKCFCSEDFSATKNA